MKSLGQNITRVKGEYDRTKRYSYKTSLERNTTMTNIINHITHIKPPAEKKTSIGKNDV